MHTYLEINTRNTKTIFNYYCILFNLTHWCPVSYAFSEKSQQSSLSEWVCFWLPIMWYFTAWNFLTASGSEQEEEEKGGCGEIRCNTENCCQQFSDLKFLEFILLWGWFLFISCDSSLRGTMAKKALFIIVNSSFSATTKKLTYYHSQMSYWQVSTCLLSLLNPSYFHN